MHPFRTLITHISYLWIVPPLITAQLQLREGLLLASRSMLAGNFPLLSGTRTLCSILLSITGPRHIALDHEQRY